MFLDPLHQTACVEARVDNLYDLSRRLLRHDIAIEIKLIPQIIVHFVVGAIAGSHNNRVAVHPDSLALLFVDSVAVADL